MDTVIHSIFIALVNKLEEVKTLSDLDETYKEARQAELCMIYLLAMQVKTTANILGYATNGLDDLDDLLDEVKKHV